MLRFLLSIAAGTLTSVAFLHADDPIPTPSKGNSGTASQPHVTAELITETTSLSIGKPFDVALHLHMDPKWHTYWLHPGDAGLATAIKWSLPPGIISASDIQWPSPEKFVTGSFTTLGYSGDVYLLTTLTPISALIGQIPSHLEIKARVTWLVCQDECIPGAADLVLPLDFKNGNQSVPDKVRVAFFKAARSRLPASSATPAK